MKNESILAWIGTAVSLIANWDKVETFILSTMKGINSFLASLPPIILLALVIGIFWWMANNK